MVTLLLWIGGDCIGSRFGGGDNGRGITIAFNTSMQYSYFLLCQTETSHNLCNMLREKMIRRLKEHGDDPEHHLDHVFSLIDVDDSNLLRFVMDC